MEGVEEGGKKIMNKTQFWTEESFSSMKSPFIGKGKEKF